MRRLALALGLSFASGFVALSYEILWFRVYSFATAGRAWAFGIMLGAYLLGIAAGSAAARKWPCALIQQARQKAGRCGWAGVPHRSEWTKRLSIK